MLPVCKQSREICGSGERNALCFVFLCRLGRVISQTRLCELSKTERRGSYSIVAFSCRHPRFDTFATRSKAG